MSRIPFYSVLLGLCLSLLTAGYAQFGINAPTGVPPTQDLEVYTRNGFLVQQQYTRTTADPAAYTATVSCSSTPSLTALAGTLKDPSGDGNYSGGVVYTCSASISIPFNATATVKGLEISFTDLDTDPVNSTVVITDIHGNSQQFSGTTLPGRIVIPYTTLIDPDPIAYVAGTFIRFQTNSSAASGRGFSLQWRALVFNPTTPATSIAVNNAMQFDVNTGSFKAGHNNTARDYYSTALGYYNTASGGASIAMGNSNTASGGASIAMGGGNAASGTGSTATGRGNRAIGDYSTTMGYSNTASVGYSTAMGGGNRVSGSYSNAMGNSNTASGSASSALGNSNTASGSASSALGGFNTASGDYSSALGYSNTASGNSSNALGRANAASGNYSSALGSFMNTNGRQGAFMIGDSDPLGQGTTLSGLTDQFVGRFLNGYFLLTSGDKNTGSGSRTGVQIGQGQNSWASISDSTKKERFQPIDHTDLLGKINAIRLTTWNYKGQHSIRHYGPMAQDFYAAFGHDGLGQVGCDTLIYSHDFAGVTFAGVQALIRENETLKARLAQQEARLQQAEQNVQQANARLEAIEAVIISRRRVAHR